MNISLTPLQSSLNNYSGLRLVLKPIVYLVAAIALAVFAALTISFAAFADSRRERRVATPPPPSPTGHLAATHGGYSLPTGNSPQPTINPSPSRVGSPPPPVQERQAYDIQFIADAFENDRNGVYEISITDRMQESQPALQIKILSINILIFGILPNLQLRYLDDDLNAHISFDTGGMGRQYMTLLYKALKNDIAKNPSGDFLFHNNLLVPQREFSPEDLIPDATMFDEPSRETVRVLSAAPLFYHLGAVMAYIYLNPNAYLTGTTFHPAIFSAIFSISPQDIDRPFNELSDATKIAMCRALIMAQIESGEDFKYLLPVLKLLDGEGTDEEIKNVEQFYYNSCLCYAKEDEDEFLTADRSGLDLEVIKNNKEGFLKSCFDYLLQQPTDSLGTIGLTLYPIHTMAKGMKEAAKDANGRSLWSRIRPPVGSLMDEIDPENGIPDITAATRRAVERLHQGIQGSLDRQLMISKITYAEDCNDIIRQKGKFLEDWILRPETTDDQIEALLIVWSGSSTVDSDLSKKLTIEPQKIVYFAGTDTIKYGFEACPRSESCLKILKFAPVWIEESFNDDGTPTLTPYDQTREGFYRMMEIMASGKQEYKWTMH